MLLVSKRFSAVGLGSTSLWRAVLLASKYKPETYLSSTYLAPRLAAQPRATVAALLRRTWCVS